MYAAWALLWRRLWYPLRGGQTGVVRKEFA